MANRGVSGGRLTTGGNSRGDVPHSLALLAGEDGPGGLAGRKRWCGGMLVLLVYRNAGRPSLLTGGTQLRRSGKRSRLVSAGFMGPFFGRGIYRPSESGSLAVDEEVVGRA